MPWSIFNILIICIFIYFLLFLFILFQFCTLIVKLLYFNFSFTRNTFRTPPLFLHLQKSLLFDISTSPASSVKSQLRHTSVPSHRLLAGLVANDKVTTAVTSHRSIRRKKENSPGRLIWKRKTKRIAWMRKIKWEETFISTYAQSTPKKGMRPRSVWNERV